jgi:hydroxylamine dehydrogenase
MKRRSSLILVLSLALPAAALLFWPAAARSQTGTPDPKYLQQGAGPYTEQWQAPSVFQWLEPTLFKPDNAIQGSFDGPTCVQCHASVTPTIANDWKASKHAAARVYCSACHGNDHQKLAMPKPETCENCHKTQVAQFKEEIKAGHPAHARAMADVLENGWQLNKPPAEVVGCAQCHRIGSVGCDSCHTRHRFNPAEARQPTACMTCHSGVDHRDFEAYENSKHGNIWQAEKHQTDWTKPLARGNYRTPTCAYCHMPGGDHNTVRNTVYAAMGTKEVNRGAPEHRGKRERWVAVCSDCHSSRFARAQLDYMDEAVSVSFKKVREARKILEDLYKEGIMEPMPQFLAPGWKGGHAAAFGGMNYNVPTIERLFYELVAFATTNTFKGAAHASGGAATYTFGAFEADKYLAAIKSEAEKMRRLVGIEKKIGLPYVPSEFWKRGEYTDTLRIMTEPKK